MLRRKSLFFFLFAFCSSIHPLSADKCTVALHQLFELENSGKETLIQLATGYLASEERFRSALELRIGYSRGIIDIQESSSAGLDIRSTPMVLYYASSDPDMARFTKMAVELTKMNLEKK